VGAGGAPYRELFAHANYLTCDWENSIYKPDRPPDVVAPARNIPLDVAQFANFDTQWIFPLNYSVVAVRPDT